MQVYISYGQKTSGQLLLSYGFMPEPGANPHDACPLELTLAEDDPGRDAKLACLRQYGADATREFPLRLDALPQGLLLFAAFAQARPRDAAETMSLGRQLFEKVPLLYQ
jgi:histone-lysine N-methyltransferase SETD3